MIHQQVTEQISKDRNKKPKKYMLIQNYSDSVYSVYRANVFSN